MTLTSEHRLVHAPDYRSGALLLFASTAIILAAWGFQAAGYLPCELCELQRLAYYFAIPAGFVALVASSGGVPRLATLLYALIALAFLANAVLAGYHAGVEWKFWEGPQTCSGTGVSLPKGAGSLIEQLKKTQAVRCDEAQWRLFGISLSGWNALLSLWLSSLAAMTIARLRRASLN